MSFHYEYFYVSNDNHNKDHVCLRMLAKELSEEVTFNSFLTLEGLFVETLLMLLNK